MASPQPLPRRKRGSDLALVQGISDTRATLARWRQHPFKVLATWFASSLAITVLLLGAILLVASQSTPDPTWGEFAGVFHPVHITDVFNTIGRNLLVLALHSLACVAGFIAGSSMPLEAQAYGGRWGKLHDHVGRFAILFVTAATLFSLTTQALILGRLTADIAARYEISEVAFLGLLTPHMFLELVGLFLPLAAWLLASRRKAWNELLAATLVTTVIGLVMVIAASLIETYVTPGLVREYVCSFCLPPVD